MTVRRGLGRGLGALLPPAPTADREELAAAGAPLAAAPPVEALISDAVEVPLPSGSQPPADVDAGASLEGIDDREASRQLGGAELHTVEEDLGEESADRPQQGAAYFTELSIDSVRANPRQPREVFDDEALQELADSLALVGVLQPVVVRPAEGGTFELIMGERRWRAAQRAGLPQIPAIVRPTSDAALLRDALLENLHRADLNALEEAAAYEQLLDDFGVTQEELAARIGRSRPHISNTIRLLRLSPAVQRRVAAGVLSAGHARALLSVADAEAQDRLASRVVAEGLSVRALEELVATPAGETSTSLRGRASAVRLPELAEIADRLSERFETRCSVDLGKRKGKITIEFATLEDLHRILRTVEQSSDRRQL